MSDHLNKELINRPMDSLKDSVTVLLPRLQAGDVSAVEELFQRYWNELVVIASARLAPGLRRQSDAEDVACSALASLIRSANAGRVPRLSDRHDLWRIVLTILSRKAAKHARRAIRDKQFVISGANVDESLVDMMASSEPTPELVAELEDLRSGLLEILRDEKTRRVALLKLDGYSFAEIAHKLGCSVRTVQRKLELIQDLWSRRLSGESE